MKKIIAILTGPLLLAAFALTLFLAAPASAQSSSPSVKCGKDQVPVSISVNGNNCVPVGTTVESNVIFVWLSGLIRFLTVGIGIAATGGVVYGGFLYLTARGNSSKTQQGVTTILNALIGVGLYALAFALLNWLIPGGVLK